MTCLNCANATTKNPNGGLSPHRRAMWKVGYVGCKHDAGEATSYSTILYHCDKWEQASAEQMEKRRTA